MRLIELVAFPSFQLLDIAGPLQVFASANDLEARSGRRARYCTIVSAADAQVISSSGLAIAATPFGQLDEAPDTVIAAGGYGVNAACDDQRLIEYLRERCAGARRVASVCSGAFLLATCGMLDGRRAVTHWQRCGEFAQRFPAVRLDPAPIFVRDGAVWTSAGVTAGIDLALALVEADLGHAASMAVARQLVVFLKRPGNQAQFSAPLALQAADRSFEALNAWMAERPAQDLTVPALAGRVHMSVRSFQRHYRAATGRTPAEAVEMVRLEAARRQLETGTSVKQAAARSGFGSQETMRRAFLRIMNVTPQDYRRRFGCG